MPTSTFPLLAPTLPHVPITTTLSHMRTSPLLPQQMHGLPLALCVVEHGTGGERTPLAPSIVCCSHHPSHATHTILHMPLTLSFAHCSHHSSHTQVAMLSCSQRWCSGTAY